MKMNGLRLWGACALSAVGLAVSGQALAAKDVVYPSAATATVNGAAATLNPKTFAPGAADGSPAASDGNVTLQSPVTVGQSVVVTATWGIQNRSTVSQPGQANTAYGTGRTVRFTATTSVGGAIAVAAIPNCTVTGNSSTCATSISFPAPAAGPHMLTVTAADTAGGNNNLSGRTLNITLTTIAVVAKQDTSLVVDKQCLLLNQTSANLTSTLSITSNGALIPGALIDYYIDPALDGNGVPTMPSIGNAITDANGVASLLYNPAGLGVGDYTLYAEYGGDALYNPSNGSNALGVSYVFGGFRPPLNADGTSIFGGRVIPVKIKLFDANGAIVTNATPAVWLVSYPASGIGEEVEPATSVSAADTDNIMRYSPEEQQYIYNFDATNLVNGVYKIRVNLGDSAACSTGAYEVPITVQRKGKK